MRPDLRPDKVWRLVQVDGATSVELRIRLTPKSNHNSIDGWTDLVDGPALKARVRAMPENGAANKALTRLVADWLDLPKSTITMSAGGKSRLKRLSIDCGPNDVARITAAIDATRGT